MRRSRRLPAAMAITLVGLIVSASPALACGGLIGPNYRFICHLPGHQAYGMVGTIVVTDQ